MIEDMLTGGLADNFMFVPRWRLIWLELRQHQFWLRDPGSCGEWFCLDAGRRNRLPHDGERGQ